MNDFFDDTAEMKEQLTRYNKAYRTGTPYIPDEVYDDLLDQLKLALLPEEFAEFRKTLTEDKGNTKTNYVLGSLEKYKYEKPEEFHSWIKKTNIKKMLCSQKIDGCSFEANYRNGQLVFCASRGDGETGTDWTDKSFHTDIPKTIPTNEDVDVRGEFTLHFESLDELGYANTRNGVVGIMNNKEVDRNKLVHVRAYAYEILSHPITINNQFNFLEDWGFATPSYIEEFVEDNIHERIKEIYLVWKKDSPYMIDGVVCSDYQNIRENVFLPKNKVAFKISEDGVETTVENITWDISKAGKLIPVCNVTPTPINGTTISNVTGINAKYLCETGIGIGAKVKIVKAGEIIPKITEVVKPCTDVSIPLFCPCCSTSLIWKGVDVVCTNPDCKAATVKQVEHFIKSAGIECVSESSLRNWNIFTFNDLLKWTPDTNYKTQNDFYIALEEKVFSQSPTKIMRCFPINGMGTTIFDRVLKEIHGGNFDSMNYMFTNGKYSKYLVKGIGERTLDNAEDDWNKFYKVLSQITKDKRFSVQTTQTENNTENASDKLNGKSFLLTGTLSRKRNDIEAEIVANGGTIASSVSKNLSYLLVGEKAGSKLDKAKKLGINIITEDEYNDMIGEK